jgi:hypothetical protein
LVADSLRLVDLDRLRPIPNDEPYRDEKQILCEALKRWRQSNKSERWVWLQVPAEISNGSVATIWINTEKPSLLSRLTWQSESRQWDGGTNDIAPSNPVEGTTTKDEFEQSNAPNDARAETHNLKLSLISSFCVDGLKAADDVWQKLSTRPAMERYTWMQSDVDGALHRFLGNENAVELTAVDALAAINPDLPLMNLVLLEHHLLQSRAIALATFIPEIAAPSSSDRGRQAQKALRFLGSLATKLNDLAKERGVTERITRIELVAGSRIGKVFQSLPLQGSVPEFIAEVLPLHNVHRNIAENLHAALREEKFRDQLRSHEIVYALEQEPGPLFALGTLDSISKFCTDKLEKPPYSAWKDLVGLNVDIAHWQMSGITPRVWEPKLAVRLRIAHAHLSGHHPKAHFGDCELDDAHASRYREFIAALERYSTPEERNLRKKSKYPTFSGYVSLEFEAAPSVEAIERSVEAARRILECG